MNSKGKIAIIISLVLIAVAAIGLVLWFVLRDDSPNTAEGWLAAGERHLFEQNYEQAVVAFRNVIEIEPKRARGYTGAADGYMGLNQPDKAADVLRQGLREIPDEPAITEKLNNIIEEHEHLRIDNDPQPITPPPPEDDDTPTPPLPEESWAEAYSGLIREYDTQTFVFETNYNDGMGMDIYYAWNIVEIKYAELIDFDNDGVPELLLVANIYDQGFDYFSVSVVVFSHTGLTGGLVNLNYYNRSLEEEAWVAYSIITDSKGFSYILREGFGTDIVNYYSAQYFAKDNDEWIPTLTISSYTDWSYPDYLTYEVKFLIDDIYVEESEYQEAISGIEITNKNHLGQTTSNDIQDFLIHLDQIVVPTQ
ncbi:MAG: tetratricopeptide repeat protein [Oscillospiraceae bacterium]|nr:tetratricopeptide repeat protein [Oscillospiraceae bacterium]